MRMLNLSPQRPLAGTHSSRKVATAVPSRAACPAHMVSVPSRHCQVLEGTDACAGIRSPRAKVMAAAATAGTPSATQPPENVTYVALNELKELCSKALRTLGYSNHEVAVLNEVGSYAMVAGVCTSNNSSRLVCHGDYATVTRLVY